MSCTVEKRRRAAGAIRGEVVIESLDVLGPSATVAGVSIINRFVYTGTVSVIVTNAIPQAKISVTATNAPSATGGSRSLGDCCSIVAIPVI
jgi:hypothetical protein